VSITQINTSNTFGQWLNTTISVIDTLNAFTDGGNANTFYVNTNLSIANNMNIGGNLTVTGNITLDSIGFNDLTVSGNATVIGNVDVSQNTTLTNLTVTDNVVFPALTTLTLDTANITSNAVVSGTLYVTGNATFTTNTITDYGNFETANITNLVGAANTEIYTYIENTANSANAELLASEYLAIAVALG